MFWRCPIFLISQQIDGVHQIHVFSWLFFQNWEEKKRVIGVFQNWNVKKTCNWCTCNWCICTHFTHEKTCIWCTPPICCEIRKIGQRQIGVKIISVPATGTQSVDQGWGNGQVGVLKKSLDLLWVKSLGASGNTGDYPTSKHSRNLGSFEPKPRPWRGMFFSTKGLSPLHRPGVCRGLSFGPNSPSFWQDRVSHNFRRGLWLSAEKNFGDPHW